MNILPPQKPQKTPKKASRSGLPFGFLFCCALLALFPIKADAGAFFRNIPNGNTPAREHLRRKFYRNFQNGNFTAISKTEIFI